MNNFNKISRSKVNRLINLRSSRRVLDMCNRDNVTSSQDRQNKH